MNFHHIDHPWFDEEFYKTGSFVSAQGGRSVIFSKGGVVRPTHTGEELSEVTFIKKFFSEDYLIHSHREKLTLSKVEIQSSIRAQSGEIIQISTQVNQDELFRDDFLHLKSLIPESLAKAVLLSREEYTSESPEKLKKHIIARAFLLPQGRPYGFWHDQTGIVGCTPETLFELSDGIIHSEALAGTASLGQECELLNSKKDRGEHEFVIRDIYEKFRSLGLQVFVGGTTASPFSQIIHLRTPIQAKASKSLSVLSLSSTLSPTAALGGYPANTALSHLQSTGYSKIFPERIFGSVIGHISETSVGLVMIRNLQWEDKSFFIESGVGIVEDSEFPKEMQEIKMKREVVRNHYL